MAPVTKRTPSGIYVYSYIQTYCTVEDEARLDMLCGEDDVSRSRLIRGLIRAEFEKRGHTCAPSMPDDTPDASVPPAATSRPVRVSRPAKPKVRGAGLDTGK